MCSHVRVCVQHGVLHLTAETQMCGYKELRVAALYAYTDKSASGYHRHGVHRFVICITANPMVPAPCLDWQCLTNLPACDECSHQQFALETSSCICEHWAGRRARVMYLWQVGHSPDAMGQGSARGSICKCSKGCNKILPITEILLAV